MVNEKFVGGKKSRKKSALYTLSVLYNGRSTARRMKRWRSRRRFGVKDVSGLLCRLRSKHDSQTERFFLKTLRWTEWFKEQLHVPSSIRRGELKSTKHARVVRSSIAVVVWANLRLRHILSLYSLSSLRRFFCGTQTGSRYGFRGSKGRLMNHSCNPNCELRHCTVDGTARLGVFARRERDRSWNRVDFRLRKRRNWVSLFDADALLMFRKWRSFHLFVDARSRLLPLILQWHDYSLQVPKQRLWREGVQRWRWGGRRRWSNFRKRWAREGRT